MLLRPELRGVARVGELVGAMQRARVDSCRTLAAAWAQQPALLQRELAAWLNRSQHALLLRLWPLAVQQARAGCGGAAGAGAGDGGRGGGKGKGKGKEGKGRGGESGGAGKGKGLGKQQAAAEGKGKELGEGKRKR